MTDQVRILVGSFQADILLDKLTDFPIPNLRKLFKLVHSEQWANEQVIERLGSHIAQAVPKAQAEWEQTSEIYKHGFRTVPDKQKRDKQTIEILQINRLLSDAIKKAKAEHARWLKVQEAYQQTFNDLKGR